MTFFHDVLTQFAYVIAVVCACIGSFCMALGLIMMKLANIKLEKLSK